MKNLILILALSLSSTMAFAKDCTEAVVEHYVLQPTHIMKISLEMDNGNRAIYVIRGNQQGGDFQDEAVVDSSICKVLATYTIWAE